MVQIQPQNVTKLKFKCLCNKSSPINSKKNKRTEHKHEFTEQTGSRSKFSQKKKQSNRSLSYQQNVTEKKEKKIEIRGNGGSRLPSKRGG